MTHASNRGGFAHPASQVRRLRRRSTALAQFAAGAALVASIGVVAATVSLGIAHAETLSVVASDSGRLALAGLVFFVGSAGWLTAAMMRATAPATRRRTRESRD